MGPEDILPTYERVAGRFGRERDKSLFERAWLDRLVAEAPGPTVLDLGCGTGEPIARYLAARGSEVTGVDGATAMLAQFRRNLPSAEAIHADMRGLKLGRRFDAILAWNSFFHLSPSDQRAMFPVFAAHAAPGAILMFTSGPRAGEPLGEVGGEPVYHASLDPQEYQALLVAHAFEPMAFVAEDPACRGHTVWMARA
jgi:cyclopropane fatty-acyl-phospholipid synthase-like methyltransferase